MPAAKHDLGRRRALAWMRRTGGLTFVTPLALDLLVRRLHHRRVALLCLTPAFAAAVAVLAWGVTDWTEPGRGSLRIATACWAAVSLCILAAWAAGWLGVRADARMAGEFPYRHAREEPVGVTTVLGRSRLGALCGIGVLEYVAGAVQFVAHPAWWDIAYLGALVISGAVAALAVRECLRRPTVAVDAVSLTIDERLRSEDAINAATIIVVPALAFRVPIIAPTPAWLAMMWIVVNGASFLGWAVARTRRPWPTTLGRPVIVDLS